VSFTSAKIQLKAALQAITWVIPASAAGILQPTLHTSYQRVDTQQFAGEETALDDSQLPYVRMWIPTLDEHRITSGGDAGSYKEQRFPAHLFIYQAGLAKDWQGLADYFDAVVDATLAYFRNNSAPQGQGQVTPGANDQVRGWGLHQAARVELTKQAGGAALCQATIDVDVIITIV
jgi:hypothetical protein